MVYKSKGKDNEASLNKDNKANSSRGTVCNLTANSTIQNICLLGKCSL
jgi:hypothetical protein